MGQKILLRCRECRQTYEPLKLSTCEKCLAPLDVIYVESLLRKEELSLRERNIWRYLELLPLVEKRFIVNMNTGFTPLIFSERLSSELGVKLFIKNDTVNPTFSFKDRPAEVAVSKAVEFKDSSVCCVSTGNLAASVAAHASKAGLDCYVITPSNIEREKLSQIHAYNAKIIAVRGTYDEANRLATIASFEFGWNIVNITTRPYYVEGSKTIAYEICEQLNWEVPDYVVIPCASGALLRAIYKGFSEFREIGLINDVPSLVGAQAEGCAPIALAFKENRPIVPVIKPETIAKSIAIGDPADGRYAISAVRETKGYFESSSDDEIIEAILKLGSKEGIFAEPAGAVSLAVAKKLIEEGKIEKGSKVVCCVTGNGFKAQQLISSRVSVNEINPEFDELKNIVSGGMVQYAKN